MTTSILSHLSGDLRGVDIQTLKDYALEAPYEWRKLFESIIDILEAVDGMDIDDIREMSQEKADLEEELEELKESTKEAAESLERLKVASLVAVKQVKAQVTKLQLSVREVSNGFDSHEVDGKKSVDPMVLKAIVDETDDELVAVVDELEAAARGEMTAAEEDEADLKVKAVLDKASKKK